MDAAASCTTTRTKHATGVPSRDDNFLRTCQWNIHYLVPNYDDGSSRIEHAHRVADTLLEADADVVILNEFGTSDGMRRSWIQRYDKPLHVLCTRLEDSGYTIYSKGLVTFPTVVVTRLPVKMSREYLLDYERSVVHVQVEWRMQRKQQRPTKMTNQNCKQQLHVDSSDADDSCNDGMWNSDSSEASSQTTAHVDVDVDVFGIHLDYRDCDGGVNRFIETKKLMQIVNSSTCTASSRSDLGYESNVVISGDFNQQRECDYSTNEWKWICENKATRRSPQNDGVSGLLKKHGFKCNFDGVEDLVDCNWNREDPPPATHWTSTVIDYAYSRGRTLNLKKLFVSPSNLSDHRLVVCDWGCNEESSANRGM